MEQRRYHAMIRRKGEGNTFQWAVKVADGAFVADGVEDGESEDAAFGGALKAISGIIKDSPAIMEFDLRKDSERK